MLSWMRRKWWRERCGSPWSYDVCSTLRAMATSASSSPGPSTVARALAECFGCMLFHFVGSAAPTPVANGVILMVIVYHLAKVSGAHLNPSVTLTFVLLGHTHPIEMLIYWFSQVTGCIIGALWIAALVPGLKMHHTNAAELSSQFYDGCFCPRADLSPIQIFGWEAVGTLCFLAPIFSVVWYTQNKSGYGNTGPLIVGLSLMGTAMAVGPWTGAALNPARVLGSPVVFSCGEHAVNSIVYYITGELTGAAVVTLAIMPWYGIAEKPWYRRSLITNIDMSVTNNALSDPQSTDTSDYNPNNDLPVTVLPPQPTDEDSQSSEQTSNRSEKTYTWGALNVANVSNYNTKSDLVYTHRRRCARSSFDQTSVGNVTPRSNEGATQESTPLPILDLQGSEYRCNSPTAKSLRADSLRRPPMLSVIYSTFQLKDDDDNVTVII